jgi:UPF0271 protein
MHVDLNADVGESFGPYTIGDDAGLMRSVTSVSVAAGFHGGDPGVLRGTIQLARAHGLAVGAHPGFADRQGFGRREFVMSPQDVEDMVLYQIAAVAGVAAAEGLRLRHVKPHGALYNMAARDRRLAEAIVRAVAAFDVSLTLLGLPGSCLLEAAGAACLATAAEGFADRAYAADGSLAPRSVPGAVISDDESAAARTIRMVKEGVVETLDGTTLRLDVQTVCVHGDTPGAAGLASRVRAGLESAGILVAALG